MPTEKSRLLSVYDGLNEALRHGYNAILLNFIPTPEEIATLKETGVVVKSNPDGTFYAETY